MCTTAIIRSGLSTKSSRSEHCFIIKTRFLFRFAHKYFGIIIKYIAMKDIIEASRYEKWQLTIFLTQCHTFYDHIQLNILQRQIILREKMKYLARNTYIFWQIYVASGGVYTLP